MIHKSVKPCFPSQVDALQECIDLVKNGYMQRVASLQPSMWYVKYYHCRNGNTIIVKWVPGCMTIGKNGKVVKCVQYPDELISR